MNERDARFGGYNVAGGWVDELTYALTPAGWASTDDTGLGLSTGWTGDDGTPDLALTSADVQDALRFPGATVAAVDAAELESADAAGDPLVWLVTADAFAAGYDDLDNRPITVGLFATLAIAVTAVARYVLDQTGPAHNPAFTQVRVQGWSR
jgi:hypothetical protein